MTDVTLYKDRDRPDLKGTLSFDDSPDLTGVAVALTMITPGGTKAIDAASCTVTVSDGVITWTYDVETADTATVDEYYAYVTVTFSDGATQDVPVGTVSVALPYG